MCLSTHFSCDKVECISSPIHSTPYTLRLTLISPPFTGEELCSIECPEWTFIEQTNLGCSLHLMVHHIEYKPIQRQ